MTTDSKERLFFALWPDEAVRDQVRQLQHRYAHSQARLNHQADLHVTLVFLGSVREEQLGCLLNAAADASSLNEPFELDLNRVGSWRKPKILWAAPDFTPAPLQKLVSSLNGGVAACGFTPEDRPYRPHVTLARKGEAVDQQPLAEPVHWKVSQFVLASSGGTPPEPRYRVLKKWQLDS